MESSASPPPALPSSPAPPTSPPSSHSSSPSSPPVVALALFVAAWGTVLWNFVFVRIGWRADGFPRSPAELLPVLASFAAMFLSGILYQLVFRGWSRTASAPSRFFWTLLAPCAVVALTLGIATRF